MEFIACVPLGNGEMSKRRNESCDSEMPQQFEKSPDRRIYHISAAAFL